MRDDERRTTEHITRIARDTYHAPPATPRDEMWAEIEARLAARETEGDGGDVLPLADRHRASKHGSRALPWWLGIAAALVIGLGIGRLSSERGMQSGPERDSAALAEAPAPAPVDAIAADDTGADSAADSDSAAGEEARDPAAGEVADPRPSSDRMLAGADSLRPSPEDRQRERILEAVPAPAGDRADPGPVQGSGDATLPYLVATRQHLGRSESFLTSMRAELDEGTADPQVGPWARSLLVRTRLLLGSPAAGDVETRRLLEDLELMLAQIAIAAEARDPGEARILDRGLEEGNLLYRLRSATDGNIGTNARGLRASSL